MLGVRHQVISAVIKKDSEEEDKYHSFLRGSGQEERRHSRRG